MAAGPGGDDWAAPFAGDRARTLYLIICWPSGPVPDADAAPATFNLDRRELTEDNFDDAYAALVGEYDKTLGILAYAPLRLDQGSSPVRSIRAPPEPASSLSQQERG